MGRLPVRELLERVHTVASVAESLAMTDQDVRDVLMGTAMDSLRKLANRRAEQSLKRLASHRRWAALQASPDPIIATSDNSARAGRAIRSGT